MPDPTIGVISVVLTREQAESLAFPLTMPTAETQALAEAGRERIRAELDGLYEWERNHQAREGGDGPTACTCGGVRSSDPLRHGFDCPVRTVFSGLDEDDGDA